MVLIQIIISRFGSNLVLIRRRSPFSLLKVSKPSFYLLFDLDAKGHKEALRMEERAKSRASQAMVVFHLVRTVP